MNLSKDALARIYREGTACVSRENCLSETLMVRAATQALKAAEREQVADHLATCSDCAQEYRLIRAFGIWARELAPQSDRRPRYEWSTTYPFAIAALLVACFTLGIWLISLRHANGNLTTRLREQIATGERTALQARQQLDRMASQIAELHQSKNSFSQPQLNTPIIDLDPINSSYRSSTNGHPAVQFPAAASVFSLVLNADNRVSFPYYSLEILDDHGRTVWSGTGLERSRFDTFTLIIPRSLLMAGQYRIRLYGRRNERKILIDEYRLAIQ